MNDSVEKLDEDFQNMKSNVRWPSQVAESPIIPLLMIANRLDRLIKTLDTIKVV